MSLLDLAEARIGAIAWGGRGVDGSLGDRAQQLSIPNTPTPRFRPPLQNADVTHVSYPAAQSDRVLQIRWRRGGTRAGVNTENTNDPRVVRVFQLEILVVYLHGEALAKRISLAPGTGETLATVKYAVEKRALHDADRLALALGCTGLFQQTGDDPALRSCVREGDSECRDLDGNRVLCVSPYVLTLIRSTSLTYD